MSERLVMAYEAGSAAEAELARMLLHAAGIYAIVSDTPPLNSCGLMAPSLRDGSGVYVEASDVKAAQWTITNSGRIIPAKKKRKSEDRDDELMSRVKW